MADGLPSYPEYKESKLPWLGKIPAHWDEKRAKFYLREVDERTQKGTEELLSVSHLTGVTPRSQKNVTMFKAESYASHKLCRPGDIVVNTMWAWMAALGVSRQVGIVSPSYAVYRFRRPDSFLPEFVDHLLRTKTYAAEYVCRSTGIRGSRLRLYPDKFLDIPVVRPPLAEQETAVAFLRCSDHPIRRLIRNKRRTIELLNAQKQAIINQAVTRGLDPSPRLKPSGIDSLGEIPAHWNIRRLKNASRIIMGQSPPSAACNVDGQGRPFLQGCAEFGARHPSPVQFCSSAPKIAPPGSLLMSVRAPVGTVNAADQEYGIGRGLCAIVPDLDILDLDFVLHSISTCKQQLLMIATGSTYDAVTAWQVGTMRLPLASLDEQSRIVQHISDETAAIDRAVAKAQREIDLIREYRARLIADVVTGKVDVRHGATQAAELEPEEPEPQDEGGTIGDNEELTPDEVEDSDEGAGGDE